MTKLIVTCAVISILAAAQVQARGVPMPSPAPQVQAVECAFKSGFRFGLEGGYRHQKTKEKIEFNASALVAPFGFVNETRSKKPHKDTGVVGAHVAYDFFFSRIYSSLELDYRYGWGTNKAKLQFSNQPAGDVPETFHMKRKQPHDFAINLHAGPQLGDCFLVYGILSARWGRFKDKVQVRNQPAAPNAVSKSKNQTRFGYGFGLGGRYLLPNQFSVSLEGTFDTYKSGKTLNLTSPDLAILGSSIKAKFGHTHNFNLILKASKNF